MDPTLQAISKQTEIPVSEIPAPKTRHPFHKTPIFLMGLFVLLVIGAFFAGTYYQRMNTRNSVVEVAEIYPTPVVPTPTVDPTADWKTYLNNNYNFSLSYPQGWLVGETNGSSIYPYESIVYLRPKSLIVNDPTYGRIWIGTIKTSMGIDEYIKDMCKDGYCDVKKAIDIKIDNLPAKRLDNLPGALAVDSVFLKQGNFIFRFATYVGTAEEQENRVIFDQILKTFKFLDSSASASAGN